jgi:protein arginine N-methyltransferase 5
MNKLAIQNRWFAEPVRMLAFEDRNFVSNAKGYPVLSKSHQQLITQFMKIRPTPYIVLCDIDPIIKPGSNNSAEGSGFLSMMTGSGAKKPKDLTPHLTYLRHLESTQPALTAIERFGSGYQDYLQAPLQPLSDNLESTTYEVFEKDPVKYEWYEKAISAALEDWIAMDKIASGPEGKITIAVVGAGRGPLVYRAMRASDTTGIAIDLWALEKNPNAQVVLHNHNRTTWNNRVTIVKGDMRSWEGPRGGKVDILVSELLGSFGDNELSPECLDGVQHVLNPKDGISIPSSYSSHIAPIIAPKLHAEIANRALKDDTAPETPYVVMLHAVDQLSTSIEFLWDFHHPLDPAMLKAQNGSNTHNNRTARKSFACPRRGMVHGVAGYFETVLYDDVELSIRPDTIDEKSKDMISWFPLFFPLKVSFNPDIVNKNSC